MRYFFFLIIALVTVFQAGAQSFVPLLEGVKSGFRGLATHGKQTIWVSGSNGTIGYSTNQGKDWNWVNPKGYETFDFRDIEVFSAKEAVVMSSGTPTVILRTTDAGRTWKEVFRDDRPAIFLNAIAFEGKKGYALGDPIDGLFQLFTTTDKGKTWQDISQDMVLFADQSEIAFAASGSSIQLLKDILYIGTGGKYSSIFAYNPKALRVDKYDCPIWSGQASTGVFAIDFWDKNYGIAVGGNYMDDKESPNNVLITRDGGLSWIKPQTGVHGYRSDVVFLTKDRVLATGTSGTDFSQDGGMNWKNISYLSFNTLAKTKDGKSIYAAGSEGKVYKIVL